MPWLVPQPTSSDTCLDTNTYNNSGLVQQDLFVQQDWNHISPIPSSPSFRGNSTTPAILSPDIQ